MKDLKKENQRLLRAISNLTLDKLILQEAARGNFGVPPGDSAASISDDGICQSGYLSDGSAEYWAASVDAAQRAPRGG